jgi:hypothetical protein
MDKWTRVSGERAARVRLATQSSAAKESVKWIFRLELLAMGESLNVNVSLPSESTELFAEPQHLVVIVARR